MESPWHLPKTLDHEFLGFPYVPTTGTEKLTFSVGVLTAMLESPIGLIFGEQCLRRFSGRGPGSVRFRVWRFWPGG